MNTSQDFIRGIDISGLTTVSASQLIQLVDAGRTASDKGLNIITTDSALNMPVVPNPDIVLEGVIPTFWKRYIWIRVPFNNTGFVYLYAWNENLVSDPIYLKWQSTSADIVSLTAQVAAALVRITNLETHETTQDALILSVQSNTNINTDEIDLLSVTIASLQTEITNAIWPIGSYRITARLEADSGTWCIADGRLLNRNTYAALFAAIFTLYGIGDGTTTFNIPDCRSRMLVGASKNGSVPVGLTQRIPQNPGGEETHLLLSAESGLPVHKHTLPTALQLHVDSLANGPDGGVKPTSLAPIETNDSSVQDAAVAHNNMPPFLAGFIMLRIA